LDASLAQHILGRKGEHAAMYTFDTGTFMRLSESVIDLASNSCVWFWLTATGVQRGYPGKIAQFVATATNPRHIAADESAVYWTEGRAVRKALTP
jgi:hypothetical protein